MSGWPVFDNLMRDLGKAGVAMQEVASENMQRAQLQEASFEERVEEEVRSRTCSMDELATMRAVSIARTGELDRKAVRVQADEAQYNKTAEELRAELRPLLHADEQARADKLIATYSASADQMVNEAQAASKHAIAHAEGARIEQLTLLLNRFAHELVALDSSKVALYDYLVVTNQQKGRSGRKDCTDADLRKIRAAWESRL